MMRETALITLICLAVAATFAAAFLLRYTLCALLGGAVIGVAMQPVIDRGARLGLSRRAVGGIVFGSILVLALAGLVWLAPLAGEQLASLGARLPEMLAELHGKLISSSSRLLRSLGELMPPLLQSRTVTGDNPVLAHAAMMMGGALRASYVMLLILVVAATVSDASTTMRRLVARFIPEDALPQVCGFVDDAEHKLGAYVRGQLVICGLSASIATVAYLALGLPYALVLGLATGILEIVPVIGPLSIGAVVLLIAIVAAPAHAVWVGLVLVLNHLAQTYLVTPRVMDRAIGVTPFAVLLSVVVSSALLGVPGAVLAVPFAAIVQLALDRLLPTAPARVTA